MKEFIVDDATGFTGSTKSFHRLVKKTQSQINKLFKAGEEVRVYIDDADAGLFFWQTFKAEK